MKLFTERLALSYPSIINLIHLQMYKVEEESGVVHLTLSSDSTCINKLHSAWEGFETLVLTPTSPIDPAPEVQCLPPIMFSLSIFHKETLKATCITCSLMGY